jgi:hypothetical protein
MAKNRLGYENAACIRQRFEPRRNVDAVSIEVLTLHHHVTKVDANPEDNSAIIKGVVVGRFHGLL